jgi:hypothetical protein
MKTVFKSIALVVVSVIFIVFALTVGGDAQAAGMGYPAPGSGYPAPIGYPAPVIGYPAPEIGYPAPIYAYPAPSIEPTPTEPAMLSTAADQAPPAIVPTHARAEVVIAPTAAPVQPAIQPAKPLGQVVRWIKRAMWVQERGDGQSKIE